MPSQDDAASEPTTVQDGSLGGADVDKTAVDGAPPHAVPLAPIVLALDTKALIDTVNWLCERMQASQTAMDRVMRSVNMLQSASITEMEARNFLEESVEERIELL